MYKLLGEILSKIVGKFFKIESGKFGSPLGKPHVVGTRLNSQACSDIMFDTSAHIPEHGETFRIMYKTWRWIFSTFYGNIY